MYLHKFTAENQGMLKTPKEILREEGLPVSLYSYLFISCHQLLVLSVLL
jgi:hypothetical protein